MLTEPEFHDLIPVTPENPRSGEGSMLELTDGRLLFAYTSFEGHEDDARAAIVARRSGDLGATWTEPETVIADEGRENVMSVSLLRLQSGGILMFYLRKDSRTDCSVWVRRSDDEGLTWGEAVSCTPEPRYQGAVNDCAVQLAVRSRATSGRVIVPYEVCDEVWTEDEHVEAGCAYSDDEGATWSRSNLIYAPRRGVMEPRVVELRDGRLWMLMRTDQGVIYESRSEDRGATWDEPTPSGIESPQSPFVFTRIPATGDLLVIRNPVAKLDEGTHQGYRTPLRAAISRDEGATWTNERDLEPDTSHTYCYLSACFVGDLAVFSYYVGSMEMPLQCLRIARVPTAWFYE